MTFEMEKFSAENYSMFSKTFFKLVKFLGRSGNGIILAVARFLEIITR